MHHRGANTSAESPDRIAVIVKALKEEGIPVKYSDIESLERKQQTDLQTRNCSACTSDMAIEETECPICGTRQTHIWSYTKDVAGDTTFQTPLTNYVVERARQMVLQAVESANERALTLCLTRPPGHHACSDKKRKGFCHHNFIVDALDAFHQKGLNAVIVDIDAHHGDGTEFEVLQRSYGHYASIHGFGPNVYPGTGTTSTNERICNIPLHAKAGTVEWLHAWHERILPFVRSVSPDIILLSCGLDAHEMDTLAPLRLTTDCYIQVGKDLSELQIPVFAILEGGYCLSALSASVKAIVNAFISPRFPLFH